MKKLLVFIPISTFVFCLTIFAQSKTVSQNYIYIPPVKIKEFTQKLNELGKLGYKLKLVERNTEFSPPENPNIIEIAGVVELEEGNTFEYESFQSLTLSDFMEQATPKSEVGFYFSKRISYSIWQNPHNAPEPKSPKGTTKRDIEEIERSAKTIKNFTSQEPVDGSLFILERKNGQIKPIKFKFATAVPGTSVFGTNIVDNKKVVETLEVSINEIDTINYKPVAVFFSSAVFKTKVSGLPTILFQNDSRDNYEERPLYKVPETFQPAKNKKVELNSEKGFNIETLHQNFILTRQANRKISYYWFDINEKKISEKLTEMAEKGWKFVVSGVTYTTYGLIFEKMDKDDGKRFEYKVLSVVQLPNLRSNNNLSYEFNEFIKQGYQPRSLFYNNGMNVLFEKSKN